MADKELIVRLLERITRRVRSAQRMISIGRCLSIALIFPLLFKFIDLLSPFRGTVVVAFLAVWGIASAVWIIRETRGHETLTSAANSLDRRAHLQDQMKSAYWFIRNPSRSESPAEWVEVQIRRAAKSAERLQIESLYPSSMPRTFYRSFALIAVFAILNFLPQSLNHNWIYGESAPPFRLTSADKALVERATKLLEKTEAGHKLEKIVSALQQGTISSEVAQQQLEDLRQQIDDGNLELNNILNALTAMAGQLEQSPELAATAQAMTEGDPAKAADEIRDLAEKLGVAPAAVLRGLRKSMAQAAASPPAALQALAQLMQQAADALAAEDPERGKAALEDIAKALDELAEKITGQQQQSQAVEELAELQNTLEQEGPSVDSASGGGGDQAPAGEPTAGDTAGPGEGTGTGQVSGNTGAEGEELPPDKTKLDVQLTLEGLKGQAAKAEELKDLEEASKQKQSAMDYRDVPSQLSPAQKDALNQNRLPREQREIVKYYFEEIRPQPTKPIKQ